MRAAFHAMGSSGWTGGSVYLRNLIHSLTETANNTEVFMLRSSEKNEIQRQIDEIDPKHYLEYKYIKTWTPTFFADSIIKYTLNRNLLVEIPLKKHNIDVVFGPALFFKYPGIATLSWLPDFQHIHLPHLFTDDERENRDRIFMRCAKNATFIILMSEAVKRDFLEFAPKYAHKVRVLHPVCIIPQSIYNINPNFILEAYNLPEKFFFVPNQFWVHKNHLALLISAKKLKDEGIKVNIVFTGNSNDYRNPNYYPELCRNISILGIRDQIIYLGLVPIDHLFQLMRQSICVINPSLFEGWGMTVDEARSIGKKALLSDIPVHREQAVPNSLYFDPYNPDDLKEKMKQIWIESPPGPDIELESHAKRDLPIRQKNYAHSFISIAKEALENSRGKS
jgi:glycosyltransferase involved in cell wall biosynthesis